MISGSEYKLTITGEPFLFHETKKVAILKQQELSDADIRRKVINDNVFQYKAKSSLIRICPAILRRLNALDQYLLNLLLNADIEISKMIVFYSIMKTDRLFFEFINEIFKEKLILREQFIEDKDFNIFIQNKREQSVKINGLQESTVYKVRQVFMKILFESGLITSTKDRGIIKPYIESDLKNYLISIGDQMYVKAILGEF